MSQTTTQDQDILMAVPTIEVEQTEVGGVALTLPVLSEGYFWRVAYAGLGMEKVQLRKKIGPFSRMVDERYLMARTEEGHYLEPRKNIEVTAANMMLTRLIEDEQTRIFNGLYGDFKQAK